MMTGQRLWTGALAAAAVLILGSVQVAAEPVEATANAEESWPIAIIDRPLTLPAGWMSGGLSLETDRDLSTIGSAATGLWGVSFGVTDALSVGVGYSLGIRELEGRGPMDLNAGYSFLSAGPLTAAATARYSHDFMAGGDEVAGGALLWLMLGDRVALVSYGDQITYGLDAGALTASLPLAVGVQPSARWYAEVGITAAEVGVANADSALFGDDQAEVELAVYASPRSWLDLGASVAADPVVGVGDSATFGLVVMVNRVVLR